MGYLEEDIITLFLYRGINCKLRTQLSRKQGRSISKLFLLPQLTLPAQKGEKYLSPEQGLEPWTVRLKA